MSGYVTPLQAYLEQNQANQRELASNVQTAGALQTLLATADKSRRDAKLRESLAQSGGDVEKALAMAIQSGDLHGAHELAPLAKQAQESRVMQGGDMNDPDFLRRAGIALKKPEFITHAERIETQRAQDATLTTMRGTPEKTIQPDPQENAIAADQGTPAVQPAVVPAQGGLFASLAASENPQIAQAAKNYQAQMNQSGAKSITPAYWQTLAKNLQDRETALLNRPQEPLVAVVGDNGQPVMLPRSQAIGRRPANTAESAPLQANALTSAAAQVANGMPVTQVVPGYGRNIADRREQVRAEAVKQIKASNPNMTDEQAGQELANRTIDFVAGKRSVGQLTTMLGATKQAVDQLDFNVKKVTEQMAKLPSSDLSPVVNAIARGEQKWTGNPAYYSLFFYMHAAAMESARLLQGGQASVAQLHQGAAEEAKKWASVNMTPKSWNEGVAPAMLAEGQARLKTYETAIARQRLGGGAQPAPAAGPAAPQPAAAQVTATGPNGEKLILKDGAWQPMK